MKIEKMTPLQNYAKKVLAGKPIGKDYAKVEQQFDALSKRKQDELFLSVKYGDNKNLIRKILNKFEKPMFDVK